MRIYNIVQLQQPTRTLLRKLSREIMHVYLYYTAIYFSLIYCTGCYYNIVYHIYIYIFLGIYLEMKSTKIK